jgi:F-type H+-transporting ATPase subunit b
MERLISALGLSVPTLLAQVVTFLALLIILRFVAYKPLMRMLDERSKKIKESMDQTELIKEQAARADEESKRRIEAGIKEGQELVNRAARTGEELRRQAQQKAQDEAEVLINRARGEIQRERDDAVGALRKEFADLTILAAEKVIDRSLDKKAHRDIIDKVLDEAQTLKQG